MNDTKPKRTSLDRAIDRKSTLCDITTSVWFEAHRRGESHKWILDQITQRVYGHAAFKKLPRWAQAEVSAHGMAMLQAAQGWMLGNVWLHDGTAYANNWDNIPEHVRELIRADKLKLVTVWAEYSQRFVDRPADSVKQFS